MERTLQVLDAAVLLVSAPDGVTGQVRILWKLLQHYHVPAFIFVNKMDQPGTDPAGLMAMLRAELSPACVDMCGASDAGQALPENWGDADTSAVTLTESALEDLVMTDDRLTEEYLQGKMPADADIRALVARCRVFPCFFGSALRQYGIAALLEGLARFAPAPDWPETFGARCFKISTDGQGKRLAWLKVTGGCLRVRDALPTAPDGQPEKISQIRICEGNGYRGVQEVSAGQVCAVTGLTGIRAGDSLGDTPAGEGYLLQPFSSCVIRLEEGTDPAVALRNLRLLEEEEPMLHIGFDPQTGEITAQVMGQVQKEILRELVRDRFGMRISFGPARILYKETIVAPVEGVGHYEPLRHYAEVHLLLEPTGPGSGLSFAADCSTDVLRLNWQRLILTHLQERTFRGVLTGAEITDLRITVIGGRAHEKHTEGGDFREATYRAVRQGLMMAQSVLLEPWLSVRASLPSENAGRILADVQRMGGTAAVEEITPEGQTVITGTLPAAEAEAFQEGFTASAHGAGQLELALKEYAPCRDAAAVTAQAAYDPDADTEQPSWSVFCSHGAGTPVPWDKVREYMHVDTGWRPQGSGQEDSAAGGSRSAAPQKPSWKEQERRFGAEEAELREIFERTYGSWTSGRAGADREEGPRTLWKDQPAAGSGQMRRRKSAVRKPGCLLVDGYNIIYASEELHALALRNLDAARDQLLEELAGFHGMRDGELIVVFDAWKVPGGAERRMEYGNLHVVYTREAETADAYIEKTVHALAGSMDVTVATSDALEQMIILGEGARRMSARELLEEMRLAKEEVRRTFTDRKPAIRKGLLEDLSGETAGLLEKLKGEDFHA